jgi:hypothetical protein
MDRFLNSQLKTVFLLIILLSLVCAICNTLWTKKNFKNHWYLELKGNNNFAVTLNNIFQKLISKLLESLTLYYIYI